jgi:integrase
MARFNLNLRDANSPTESVIHLIVRWNNNKLVIPTNLRIHPKFWDKDSQRAKKTKSFPEHPEFNIRLNEILARAERAFNRIHEDIENTPSIEEVKEEIIQRVSGNPTKQKVELFDFIEKFIQESVGKVNHRTEKVYSKTTILSLKRTFELLKEFKRHNKRKVSFSSIDLNFYFEFTQFLTKDLNFSINSIGKHIKNLKTFMNSATERGYNSNLFFRSKSFRVITEKSEKIYLRETEIEQLLKLDLAKNPKLDRVRDLFIVGCWTGLRFSDFSNIQPENIKGDFIEITTKKTAEEVVIPIHPIVKKIIKKYSDITKNSLPPSISNVKMNLYLKELGKLVDSFHSEETSSITKGGFLVSKNKKKYELLTTHTARRSFASNLFLDGVPSETIRKITGHKTEKAFLQYLKITPQESAKILKLHWERKNNLKAV